MRIIKFIFLLLAMSFLMTSCYTSYVSLHFKLLHGAMWNSDSSQIAFFVQKKAFRAPVGIARFPDGGISKMVFHEVGLYVFNVDARELEEVFIFDKFPDAKTIQIAYVDSLIYCLFNIDWEYRLSHAKSTADTLKIYQYMTHYARPVRFNLKTGKVDYTDTAVFSKVYKKARSADYMMLHNHLEKLPLAELGLVLQEIFPKSDNAYVDDFIYSSKGGNRLTKRAIAEQIIAKMSRSDILKIKKKLDRQKDRITGFERQQFEFYSSDKYKLIQVLLDDKQ